MTPKQFAGRFVAVVVLPAAVTAAVFALLFGVLLIVGAASAKWEVSRRKSVCDRLGTISGTIEQDPAGREPYERLASATRARAGWDRTAAFAEIKTCARAIIEEPDAHKLFEVHLVPVLQRGLTDDDPYVREEAARAAGAYGPLAAPLKQTLLLVARQHPNQGCGWFSVRAIGNIGPQAADLTAAIAALQHANDPMAAEVTRAVAKLTAAEAPRHLP